MRTRRLARLCPVPAVFASCALLPGRGKRGSARVIYLYVAPDARVYFLLVYRKNVKETLSAAEKQALAALARFLRGESP